MSDAGPYSEQLLLLVAVDQVDRALGRVAAERAQIRNEGRQAKAELDARSAELDALEQARQALQTATRERESRLKWVTERYLRVKDMAHVKSERELEAAQRDVNTLLAEKDGLETALLQGMEEAESSAARKVFLTHTLERQKREVARAQAARRVRFDVLGEEQDALKSERQEKLSRLVPELRATYEHAVMLHPERACVTVVNDTCPPCAIGVPPQHVVNVLVGRSFHICQHCKRLILPEGLTPLQQGG